MVGIEIHHHILKAILFKLRMLGLRHSKTEIKIEHQIPITEYNVSKLQKLKKVPSAEWDLGIAESIKTESAFSGFCF